MSQEQYIIYRDGRGRFLLQSVDNGLIAGLLFPAMPGESARAFSYDYGSIWYREQLINLSDFPELAEMPFFTLESCGSWDFDQYFNNPNCAELYPMLGATFKFITYSPSSQILPHFDQPLWQYKFPNPDGLWTMPILSIWVNEQGCFLANRDGFVIGINHQGQFIQQYHLPTLTRCLYGTEESLFVTCDDGQVYELTGKLPQPVYDLRPPDNYWSYKQLLTLKQEGDCCLVAEDNGLLTCLNLEGEKLWQQENLKDWLPFLLCTDNEKVYQGHYRGLTCLEKQQGNILWKKSTSAPVLCGELRENELVFGCSDRNIYTLSTHDPNTINPLFTCAGVPYCITLSPDGQTLFISDYDRKIYILNRQGKLMNTITLERGAAMSMKVWDNRLYIGTNQGVIICSEGFSPKKNP